VKGGKFCLILLTIFACLFLFTYSYNAKLSNDIEKMRKLTKAYELYVSGSNEFSRYVQDNNLKELDWLISKKLLSDVRSKLDQAKENYRKGNYADASVLLREVKDVENPWMDEIYFYLGMSLYKIGELESSKLFLSAFIENFQYSIYRKEALLLLRDLSGEDVKRRVDDILSKMGI